MCGIGIGLAVAIGDRLAGDSISSIRPLGEVLIAATLAAERPPACIDRTDATQDAQLGLAHPNNHNLQRPKPNYQPRLISKSPTPNTCRWKSGIGPKASVFYRRWGVMADVECRNHENHVFGDVRRVIANPFEMAGDENQVQ